MVCLAVVSRKLCPHLQPWNTSPMLPARKRPHLPTPTHTLLVQTKMIPITSNMDPRYKTAPFAQRATLRERTMVPFEHTSAPSALSYLTG